MHALENDPNIEALVREGASRESTSLPRRELATELATGGAFLLACAALFEWSPAGLSAGQAALAAALLALFVAANRVEFTVGSGFAHPSQLAFMPLLVLLPPAWVPPAVVLAGVLGRAPDYLRGRTHPDRLLLNLGNAWFAMGPAVVFAVAAPERHGVEHWPVYLAALAAQFLFDTGSMLMREWLAAGVKPGLWIRCFGVVYAVDLALTPLGLLAGFAAQDNPAAIGSVVPLLGLLVLLGREREGRIENTLALSEAYRGTAILMGEMLEADDPYTGGEHSKGVGALCLAVGAEMGLDARQQRELEFGSLLHDIGKLRVPDEILNKPAKLTDAEWEVIKRHPSDGQEMLDRIGGLLADVGKTVRAHHERWDGNGYPDGLKGEEIPLPARIVCACDAYSAMTTNRPYRGAMPIADALAELRACSGTQFDPDVVDAIVAVVERDAPQPLSLRLVA